MNIVVVGEGQDEGEDVHLRGAQPFLTLCGWVDVCHARVSAPATCKDCRRQLEHARALRWPGV